MKNVIESILADSLRTQKAGVEKNIENLVQTANALTACIKAGHRIYIFGNGGSAADAQHIAAEFVNRFRIERAPLPATALTTDTSILTSIGNDYSFDEIFDKQIRALGRSGDLAWGISTSGNSSNVIVALETARRIGMTTLGMTGKGGKILTCSDHVLAVESDITARIQETHITMGHILCELVDRILFPDQF